MAGAPTGFLGKLAAERPFLTSSVVAIGMTALCVIGVRRGADPQLAAVIVSFILKAIYVIAAPMIAVAIMPASRVLRSAVFFAIVLLAGALIVLDQRWVASLSFFEPPPTALTGASFGLFCYLFALSPLLLSTVRLGLVAAPAAILGAAGAAGYLALEGLLTSETAAIIAVALAIGGSIGADVSAEFSKHFAKGVVAPAAAAGHSAIAPAVFSVLTVSAYLGVQTIHSNFGAIEWPVLWGGTAAALLTAAGALVGVSGSLSLTRLSEQAAVDENRRRQWFSAAWRPMRRLLPATTALAATAIAGVVVVIAVFEAGLDTPVNVFAFLALVWAAAALAFVSLRTSILIVVIVFAATLLTGYLYSVLSWTIPALPERLAALTLTAIGLAHLTMSWRDAGEVWRNPRDIAENAMSDGMRRLLLTLGLGAASLIVAAYSFDWIGGVYTAAYYAIMSGISLILAPPMMIAMSAKTNPY